MGSINAVPSYTSYYNLPKEGNSGTGIVFAIFQIGQMTGAFFCWVSDWHGRRWPIFVGCVGTCIGAIVTSVAPTIPAFIGGRFLLSFFSTIATTAAPLYLIEIAPPQYRGTVAGMYNTLYYLVSVTLRNESQVLTKCPRDQLSQRLSSTLRKSAGATTATF
jgi:MFS family permease